MISDAARLALGTPSTADDGGISAGFYQLYNATSSILETYLHDDTRYLYLEATSDKRIIFERPIKANDAATFADDVTITGSTTIDGVASLGKDAAQIDGSSTIPAPTSTYMSVKAVAPYTSGSMYAIDTTGVVDGQIVILTPYPGHDINIYEYIGYGGNIYGSANMTENDNLAGLIYDSTLGGWMIMFSKTG